MKHFTAGECLRMKSSASSSRSTAISLDLPFDRVSGSVMSRGEGGWTDEPAGVGLSGAVETGAGHLRDPAEGIWRGL